METVVNSASSTMRRDAEMQLSPCKVVLQKQTACHKLLWPLSVSLIVSIFFYLHCVLSVMITSESDERQLLYLFCCVNANCCIKEK